MAEPNFSLNYCRICAKQCATVKNIFDVTQNDKRCVDMLECCLQQPINTNERFPNSICPECESNLVITYEFFVLYKKSEEYFVSCVNNIIAEVKEEPFRIEVIQIAENIEFSDDGIKTEPYDRNMDDEDDDALVDGMSNHSNEFFLKSEINSDEDCSENHQETPVRHSTSRTKTNDDYQCEECDKIFPTAHQLSQHLVSHSEDRPFACTQCKFKFKRKGDLKRHLLKHTGKKVFVCELCSQRFIDNFLLESHMRVHRVKKCEFLIFEC